MTDCVDNSDYITVLSLCTGYGGLELGLHQALGRPLRVVAVEIEAFAQANLVAKAEEGKLAIEALYPDVKTFPAERFSGCFDFILAGYPCQPFSVAGKQKGAADDRHLWPFIRNHIQQIRPLYVFLENVAGHLRLGFDRVVRDLDGLGYTVEAGLFTAAEVGAPHKRERLFVLAKSSSTGTGRLSGTVGRGGRQPVLRQGNGQTGTSGAGTAGELGDPQSQRCREAGPDCPRPAQRAASTGTVADTSKQGLQGATRRTLGIIPCQAESSKRSESCRVYAETKSPARPGQEQYEWEEPRVVGKPMCRNSNAGRTRRAGEITDKGFGNQQQPVKSGMGRTVDGFRSRVDELRLLGNGVVPAQAELAFRTLMEMFND